MFAEYAAAAGAPQVEDGTGMVRGWFASSAGGPNGPNFPWPVRVSTSRQGVIAMNIIPAGAEVAPT